MCVCLHEGQFLKPGIILQGAQTTQGHSWVKPPHDLPYVFLEKQRNDPWTAASARWPSSGVFSKWGWYKASLAVLLKNTNHLGWVSCSFAFKWIWREKYNVCSWLFMLIVWKFYHIFVLLGKPKRTCYFNVSEAKFRFLYWEGAFGKQNTANPCFGSVLKLQNQNHCSIFTWHY